MSDLASDELEALIAADLEWLSETESAWSQHKRKFGGLIIQFSGLAFTCLISLFILNGGDAFVIIFAVMMAACTGMICLCSHDREYCQRWLDWHAKMRVDQCAWPWPPTPNSPEYVAGFDGAPR